MRLITLDMETYYSKDYGLKKLTTEAYIRDEKFEVIGVGTKVNGQPTRWFSGSHAETKAYLDSLDIPNSYLLAHNAAFDGAILAWQFGIKPKYYLDTLSMSRPITGATVGGSLAALAKKFNLGAKGTEVLDALGKRREDFQPQELAAYGEYCKNDVEITYALYHILKEQSTLKEQYIIDLMIRMFTDPVIKLDIECLNEHLTNVQAKKEKLMGLIDSSIGRDALMSNPKFAEVLIKLGVTPPMKTSIRTGKETYAFGKTDVEFKALLEHPDPRVQAVVSARLGVKSTLEETRTESFIAIGRRGALPIMLNYYGAHTGRASGGDKINLQNLPRGGSLRKSIAAPDGHSLVACDSSQIEARVVAWLAGQNDLVKDFGDGVDIYSKFASDVYSRPIDRKRKEIDPETGKEIYPDFTAGFVGKTCVLGLGFGLGKDKFKQTLKIGQASTSVDISIEEAERIVKLYREKYAHIANLWKDAQTALEKMVAGYDYEFGVGIKLRCNSEGIHLPNGMLVRYNNLRKEDGQFLYDSRYGPVKIYGGKVVENVVQALARIVVFDQMAKIDQALRKLDSPELRFKVVLTVHDEVVSVVPDGYTKACITLMKDAMSTPPSWASDLPVACEIESGKNYAECK
jgi:DNA polymerase I-like protein with 3'-5' exonuclease and polymerase domains